VLELEIFGYFRGGLLNNKEFLNAVKSSGKIFGDEQKPSFGHNIIILDKLNYKKIKLNIEPLKRRKTLVPISKQTLSKNF